MGKRELAYSAPRGVRLVALDYLDDAAKAYARITAGGDDEALHDFRVALRRLRSWLRAFREDLHGSIRRKDLDGLRHIAAATNPGRDLDVQLEWVRRSGGGLSRRRRQGARWMEEYLQAQRESASAALAAVVAEDFPRIRAKLESRLSTFEKPVRPRAAADVGTLAGAIAARLEPRYDDLAEALDAVHTISDEQRAHEARIRAKRLRYLLEPAGSSMKEAKHVITRLTAMQDELGTLHDEHVMAHELRAAMGDVPRPVATSPSDDGAGAATQTFARSVPREALVALADRLNADIERTFKTVRDHWLDGRYRALHDEIPVVEERLHALHQRRAE
jgi:CHAD domain-containing protein